MAGELGDEWMDAFVMEPYFSLCEQESKKAPKLSQSGARMKTNGAKMVPTWIQHRSLMIPGPPSEAKSGPGAPNNCPRASKEGARGRKEFPRAPQGRSTGGQEPPKSSPERPKSAPRTPQEHPNSAPEVPKSLQKCVGEGSLGVTRKLKEQLSYYNM